MSEHHEATETVETVAGSEVVEIAGTTVLRLPAEGTVIGGEGDAMDLIGDAMGRDATWVVVPAARLGGDFFRLSTRVAGGIVQKFVNYRIGLAVTGDISEHVAASSALRDFVVESNRGNQLWFLADAGEFDARLARA
ncbi:DUF4180 domain-containing protein [Kitasatospora sp. RG8]|uniref:DUF4180 domain-containing protein n=1 Tax=Kitasatospora sp. RG8 TaxID=2820815 RepID=UPI001ADF48BB|nr:DUF4180 domain-containing protein [Kitasatospora sp. RG8]MBP0450828.1 DUF4180 domain-containing protein [Kitasatospora sp. RG8]